jgi:hypothetical protein
VVLCSCCDRRKLASLEVCACSITFCQQSRLCLSHCECTSWPVGVPVVLVPRGDTLTAVLSAGATRRQGPAESN